MTTQPRKRGRRRLPRLQRRNDQVSLRLTAGERHALDILRGELSWSEYLRGLIRAEVEKSQAVELNPPDSPEGI